MGISQLGCFMNLEIFLDSFEMVGISKYATYLTGITTNPLILAKNFQNEQLFEKQLAEITSAYPNLLINLQLKSDTADKMVEQAKLIAQRGENFIVKIPLHEEGLKALKIISNMGIKTNGTLCFSLFQARVAQDYGANYISPFLGRLEDAGENIEEFMYKLNDLMFESKILAASIRNIKHVELAIATHSAAITISERIFESIFNMQLLIGGQKLFDDAENKLNK